VGLFPCDRDHFTQLVYLKQRHGIAGQEEIKPRWRSAPRLLMGWVTEDLDLRSMPKAGWWKLLSELTYERGVQTYTVPADFETDLASIPRVLRIRFSVNGKHRRAAVLHDYLYSIKFADRKTCDMIFKSAMHDCGVSKYNAWVMWVGVRAGGWTRGRW